MLASEYSKYQAPFAGLPLIVTVVLACSCLASVIRWLKYAMSGMPTP